MKKVYKTKMPFIGLADTTKFTQKDREFDEFPYAIRNQSVGYKTLEAAKAAGHELIINQDTYHLTSLVNRKEDIVTERKVISSQINRGSLPKNLVIIFVDAMSRQRAHFKMPETMKFLQE